MSILFIYSEGHLAKYPLMPLKLLKDRSNVMSLIVTFAHGAVGEISVSPKLGSMTDDCRPSLVANIIYRYTSSQ